MFQRPTLFMVTTQVADQAFNLTVITSEQKLYHDTFT